MKWVFIFVNTMVIVALCAQAITFTSCVTKDPTQFPDPKIEAGVAKLSGKLIGFERLDNNPIKVKVILHNIVTASSQVYEVSIGNNNIFYLEIPVESDITLATVVVAGHYIPFVLTTHQQTILELSFGSQRKFHASMDGYVCLTDADMLHWGDVVEKIITTPGSADREYNMEQEVYINNAMNGIEKVSQVVHNDSILSELTKTILIHGFKMFGLNMVLFDYSYMIRLHYQNTHPEEEYGYFVAPPEPERPYYKFLSRFYLNDPQYLLTGELYSNVLQKLFTIDALGIRPLGETPIPEWLTGVQGMLTDLVGFSEGQFYDLLVSNAYGRQFEMESKPLSDKQIANIKDYFKGKKAAFAEILLRRNAEIEKLATGVSPLVINETPDVPNEQLLDAIVAKHKGKVVVIDFWATWCPPCLAAMKEIRQLKSEFKPDGVAYVYLTGPSSPEKLWREMIPGIGGDHYRLTEAQWVYLMERFGFEGIPSYVIVDPAGKVHANFTGYPGNDRMKKMIIGLLQ